jgi:uncharacterized protein YnzC (UPF0291/DUF896 family)
MFKENMEKESGQKEAQELIDNLTEEQKAYRKEYDEHAAEVQEEINKVKLWDHIAVRPETFEEFRTLRGNQGGMRSDDAFVIELLKAYKIQKMKNTGEQA